MECLKFNLSGETAFFKNPEMNANHYYTYDSIHKVALIGMLGAIIGLKGYTSKKELPEFYQKLNKLKVSVVPSSETGTFPKKEHNFTNTTNFANKGVLQVYQTWLEQPNWDIYLLQNEVDNTTWEKLKDYILNNKCVYIPYLGANDHIANIDNAELIEIEETQNQTYINSFFIGDINSVDISGIRMDEKYLSFFLPYALDENLNFQYKQTRFVYTDMKIQGNIAGQYKYNDLVLAFH